MNKKSFVSELVPCEGSPARAAGATESSSIICALRRNLRRVAAAS